jgi:hypothetical protein
MNSLIAIQQSGMASELGEVAGGDPLAAMAAAILFEAVHALMPGHGKVLAVPVEPLRLGLRFTPVPEVSIEPPWHKSGRPPSEFGDWELQTFA